MREMMTILDSVEQVESYTGVAGLNAITFTSAPTPVLSSAAPALGERTEEGEAVFAIVGQLQRFSRNHPRRPRGGHSAGADPGAAVDLGLPFRAAGPRRHGDVAEFEGYASGLPGAINAREEIDGAFSFTAQSRATASTSTACAPSSSVCPCPTSTPRSRPSSGALTSTTYATAHLPGRGRADTAYRTSIDAFDRYFVRNSEVTMVPLSSC